MEYVGQKPILLILIVTVVYCLWMDVCLYYHIQTSNRQISHSEPKVMSTLSYVTAKHSETPRILLYSPFEKLTVKLIMLDQWNHYVVQPLVEVMAKWIHFNEVFYFITPNMISFSHLPVAIVGSYYISSQSLLRRQFGVLLFVIREALDGLDGIIYRWRNEDRKNNINVSSTGAIIDGLCDGLGSLTLGIGCTYYLLYNSGNLLRNQYNLLPTNWGNKSLDKPSVTKIILIVMACVSLQYLAAAFFWLRYGIGFGEMLDNFDFNHPQIMSRQEEVFKSTQTWIIFWFWKIVNSHALQEMLLVAILFDKMWEFFSGIQYVGMVAIGGLAIASECHLQNSRQFIATSGTAAIKS